MKFNALYKHQKTLFDALRKDGKRKYIQLHLLSILNIVLELAGLAILFVLLIIVLDTDTYQNLCLGFPKLNHLTQIQFIVVLASLFLIKNLIQLRLNHKQLKGVFKLTSNLSNRIYGETFNADLSVLKKVSTGERINEITSITNSLPNQIIIPALTATAEVIFVVIAFIVLLCTYPLLLLWLCLFLIPPVLIILLYGKSRLDRYGIFMRDHMPKLYASITHVIFGFSEIKLFRLEGKMTQEFERVKDDIYEKRVKSLMLSAMAPNRLMEVIAIAGICIIALVAVDTSDASSARATLALFITAAFRILPSLNRIVGSVNTLNTFANILEFLPSIENNDLIKDKNQLNVFQSLKINALEFSFEHDNVVLQDVSFELKQGDFLGIKGESGTGKTTLSNIILGFYKPTKGEVLVNDYPLQHVINQWQGKVGLVKQEPFMLNGSIKDNIVFGGEVNQALLNKVINQTQLLDWIESLEHGLETNVGELGTMVSGGQRQRIALARCLYRDSEVLIFDEATNALDAENKSIILDLISELNNSGKSIIMISHDEQVLSRCQRILRLG